jgi:hypothetical protein
MGKTRVTGDQKRKVGKRLGYLIRASHRTVAWVAEQANCSPSFIYAIRRGDDPLPEGLRLRLAEVLEIEPDELLPI